MSIFDTVKALAENYGGSGDHAAVAGGLLEEAQGSGGIAGLIKTFQENGAGGLVKQWAGGETAPTDPNAVEQGLAGSGLIESIAQRTGIAPETVKSSLATILPIVLSHVTSNGHVTEDGQVTDKPLPDSSSLLQSVLGKLV